MAMAVWPICPWETRFHFFNWTKLAKSRLVMLNYISEGK
jgi:hypothetical protein